MKFSVCMSVYGKDKPIDFDVAIKSIVTQTLAPNEIVLVVDGPVPNELALIISKYESELKNLKVIRLAINSGHATVRQIGIENANYDYVAIMDSDDISAKDRFEKQIQFFKNNLDLDVLGGQISEFVENPENIVSFRNVPLSDSLIKEELKKRCPMNFVSVMMKRDAILKVGGYIDWYSEEDYYLWVRMTLANCKFANLPDDLVSVRVGNEMYGRRGGFKYYFSEHRLQRFMFTNKMIGGFQYIYNISIRFAVQILMTNKFRGFVFQKLARTKINKYEKDV